MSWSISGAAIHHDGTPVAVAITPEWAKHVVDRLAVETPADPPLATLAGTALPTPPQRMSLGFSSPSTSWTKRGTE